MKPRLLSKIPPYGYFFITSATVLAVGLIKLCLSGNEFLDINYGDTYYVFDIFQASILIAVLYFIAGAIYWLIRNFRTVKFLTWLHSSISIGCIISYWTVIPFLEITDTLLTERANIGMFIIMALAVIIQPIFIVNFITGIIRGKTPSQNPL